MFEAGPTKKQFDALSKLVSAQSDMLQALDSKIDAVSNHSKIVSKHSTWTRADAHLLKPLVAALIAEIAAKADNPYKELADILRRVRFTAGEFAIDDPEFDKQVSAAADLICEHAETYIRRGDRD